MSMLILQLSIYLSVCLSVCLSIYLIYYIKPLVLILPKMSEYVKTFKDKNNKLMSLHMDNGKPLKKYKTIQTKIEDFRNIGLNT